MTRTRNYLLDTNILSELVRHPQGAVAQVIARVGENAVCTSIIVASELRFGAAKRPPGLPPRWKPSSVPLKSARSTRLPTTNTPAFVLTFTPPVLRAPS
jgi:predicted nucleic acid-binding protein